ncbi:MAG: 23S rRNA (guanosine(2251)-2'-O)-methyltransferase RlmB [Rhizobiales bacterium]|jgi:23S rRNA (guanosine2251-2'-O)-methyltransferase|nr:23S rRNA (guanosine(2251)-2'-O)-methyltransferase RlmB [Hyphomicrobiales bacterium]
MRKPFTNKPGRPPQRPHRAEKPLAATLKTDRPKALSHTPDSANDLIYGIHACAAAISNPQRKIKKLWATENGLARLKEDGAVASVTPEIVHPRILDHLLTGQDAVHQGVVLEALPLKQPRLDQVARDGLIVLLDQVTDPHNVGAILRSCAAFGVKALVTTARHAPHETGVFFKAASGAYEHVPVTRVTNLSAAMEELRGYGIRLVGLDSEAASSLGEVEKTLPLALVLGAEGKGLREKTRATCDVVARLDMPGAIKSLNVSIATAISLYALTH